MKGKGGRKSTDQQNKDAPLVNPERNPGCGRAIRSSIPITPATGTEKRGGEDIPRSPRQRQ